MFSRIGIPNAHVSSAAFCLVGILSMAAVSLGGQAPAAASITEEALGTVVVGVRLASIIGMDNYLASKHIEPRGNGWVVHFPKGDLEVPSLGAVWVGPGGRRLVVEVRRPQRFMVENGHEMGPYDDVSDPVFSPDGGRMAFYARKGKAWRMVLDGEEGPEFTGQPHGDTAVQSVRLAENMAFSGDGKHFAFVRFLKPGREQLVVDSVAWPESQDLWRRPIRFSEDGLHTAIAGIWPGFMTGTWVQVDGKDAGRFSRVFGYSFVPGTAKLAALGLSLDGRSFASIGLPVSSLTEPGRRFTAYEKIGQAPVTPWTEGPFFSADGNHFVYLLADGDQADLYLDGRSVIYSKEFSLGSISLSSDGRRLTASASDRRRKWWILDLTLGPDPATGRWAVLRRRDHAVTGEITNLFLSPDGKHLACRVIRRAGKTQEFRVLLDGQEGFPYTYVPDESRWIAGGGLVYVGRKGPLAFQVTHRPPKAEAWTGVSQ
jgi:hypothetical protein